MSVIAATDERTPIPVPVVSRRRETHDVFTLELDASNDFPLAPPDPRRRARCR